MEELSSSARLSSIAPVTLSQLKGSAGTAHAGALDE